jgi:dipeptidyl aminopeptidase
VLTEVVWVGDSDLIIKETNRAATQERVAHFDFSTLTSEGLQLGVITRDVDYTKTDGGWAETGQRIHGMTGLEDAQEQQVIDEIPDGYLDILPDPEGYMHLALFSPANAKEPVFLTSGKWEIDGIIKGVDLKRRLVYFIAANPSIERHLYSVKLPTKTELEEYKNGKLEKAEVNVITDSNSPGFYDVSFSPNAGYYLLGQKSGIPWQKVEKVDDPSE